MNHDFLSSVSAINAILRCAVNELHRAGKGRRVPLTKCAGATLDMPQRGQLAAFRRGLTNGGDHD